jgi:hypothetical protein
MVTEAARLGIGTDELAGPIRGVGHAREGATT